MSWKKACLWLVGCSCPGLSIGWAQETGLAQNPASVPIAPAPLVDVTFESPPAQFTTGQVRLQQLSSEGGVWTAGAPLTSSGAAFDTQHALGLGPAAVGPPGRHALRAGQECDAHGRARALSGNPRALDRYLRREERPDFRPFDFHPKAEPAPLGTYTDLWHGAHLAAAAEDFFLVSRHEWFALGDQLGPDGLRHVSALADELPHCVQSVVIEAAEVDLGYELSLDEALTAARELNQRRRERVVVALLERGVADAEQRVVVLPIDRIGVRGVEAPLIYNRQFTGGFGGGQRGFGGGQGGRGGFGGGGFGGGGGFY